MFALPDIPLEIAAFLFIAIIWTWKPVYLAPGLTAKRAKEEGDFALPMTIVGSLGIAVMALASVLVKSLS